MKQSKQEQRENKNDASVLLHSKRGPRGVRGVLACRCAQRRQRRAKQRRNAPTPPHSNIATPFSGIGVDKQSYMYHVPYCNAFFFMLTCLYMSIRSLDLPGIHVYIWQQPYLATCRGTEHAHADVLCGGGTLLYSSNHTCCN